jgi:acetoin utilization protein AcuB
LNTLTVADLMTSDPDVVSSDTPLEQAIALMNRAERRQLPVVDNGELVGLISDRDVRLAVNSPFIEMDSLDKLHLLDSVTVGQCMTPNPVTIHPSAPLYEAAGILSRYKFGALPVMEGEELVGIITVTDLLQQMALLPEPD